MGKGWPLGILACDISLCFVKKVELHTISDWTKPEIILGNELTPDIKNSEIFQEYFDAVQKDRVSDAYEGVFVAFNVIYSALKPQNWTSTVKLFGASRT